MNNELEEFLKKFEELLNIISSMDARIVSLEKKEEELRKRSWDILYLVKDLSGQLLRISNALS